MQWEHREQFFEVIAKFRERIKAYQYSASSESLVQYRKACDRMRERNATPIEIAGSKRSYYFYRAALIACTIDDARNIVRHTVDAFIAGDFVAAKNGIARLAECHVVLDKYPPDPHRQRKNSGKPGLWLEHVQTKGIVPRSHSKRHTIAKLAKDWRAQIWDNLEVDSKYRLAIAVLACCGCRPSELERGSEIEPGVKIERVDEGLQFTIRGVKTKGGEFGQSERKITIAIESAESAYLATVLAEANGTLWVQAKARPLKDAMRRVSQRVWPKRKNHVSPYCYRHQFAADMKSDGQSIEDIAKALGHCVDDTQRMYGHSRQGRLGGNKVLHVIAAREVRQTWRQPPRTGRRLGRKPGVVMR